MPARRRGGQHVAFADPPAAAGSLERGPVDAQLAGLAPGSRRAASDVRDGGEDSRPADPTSASRAGSRQP